MARNSESKAVLRYTAWGRMDAVSRDEESRCPKERAITEVRPRTSNATPPNHSEFSKTLISLMQDLPETPGRHIRRTTGIASH